jgi:hypothetical protein
VGLGPPSERTRVRRAPQKARYDTDAVHAIIDATPFCHVGVRLIDSDEVVVLPFLHARRGGIVILHGSRSNRLLASMLAAPRVCATFTTFDGVRVARTGFHSSVSYRSVVAFGPVQALDDRAARADALDAMVEAVLPGRSREIRQPNERELALTTVVAMTIEEASAKVSEGPTEDEPEDVESHVWSGHVPATVRFGEPVGATDGAMATGSVPVPDSVRRLVRP